jgi:hypothetical protein
MANSSKQRQPMAIWTGMILATLCLPGALFGQGAKKGATDGKTKVEKPAEKPKAAPTKEYAAPRAVPALMIVRKEDEETAKKRDAQETAFIRTKIIRYQRALRDGDTSTAGMQYLKDGIAHGFFRLSRPKYLRIRLVDNPEDEDGEIDKKKIDKREKDIGSIRRGIMRDIQQAGSVVLKEKGVKAASAFRTIYLQEVLKQSQPYLKGNFYVRLNTALIIANLRLVEPRRAKKTAAVPFTPSATVLKTIIEDPDQPEAIKIVAARGIGNVLRFGELKNEARYEFGKSLIKQVQPVDSHPWYQMRLVEAMGGVGLKSFANDRAFLSKALIAVLVDKKRHWTVRAEAAKQLGRIPLDANDDVKAITLGVAELGVDMSDAVAAKPNAPYWKSCYLKLYFAFQPVDQVEKDNRVGLKTSAPTSQRKAVNDVYALMLPMVKTALAWKGAGEIPGPQVAPLKDWVKNNK